MARVRKKIYQSKRIMDQKIIYKRMKKELEVLRHDLSVSEGQLREEKQYTEKLDKELKDTSEQKSTVVKEMKEQIHKLNE